MLDKKGGKNLLANTKAERLRPLQQWGEFCKTFDFIMKYFAKYLHTLRYLKLRQIVFQALRVVKKKTCCMPIGKMPRAMEKTSAPLEFLPSIPRFLSYDGDGFNFLNRKIRFRDRIDWSYGGFGKLWCYNLNYFDFINQKDNDVNTGLHLIRDYIGEVLY